MNTPDPTFPSLPPLAARPTMVPTLSDKASLFAGAPLAAIGAYLWCQWTGMHLDSPESIGLATGAGSVFGNATGYLWHVVTVLIDRAIARG